MSNLKKRSMEIYNQHIALAPINGRLFRKTVLDQLIAETGCSVAAAATFYNNAKKASAPIEGLGRAPIPKGIRRPGSKGKVVEQFQDDDECHTVMEIVDGEVGRCVSFLMQGDASEEFDDRIALFPKSHWVHIQGLGPNSGDTFKLASGEKMIREYVPTEIPEGVA
jgi:hypothetical protein